VEDWLGRAGFEHPEEVANLFPHELSGGMAQRVCIALALARGSRFLIADEPTTGLDPTVQRAILDELRRTARNGVGILLITHDLGIVSSYADHVVIMSEGQVVEQLPAAQLAQAKSDQARALLAAKARLDRRHGELPHV
jgi:ABC-type dipeptide/oligopeptide/nickel transport system ATPase component